MELYWRALVEGKKSGVVASLSLFFLRLISLPYQAITFFRNKAYDLGLFSISCSKNMKVISVGNLTVGGSGKTPLVKLLASKLLERGEKVAIITRGYRSPAEKMSRSTLACQGEGPLFDASVIGDEPYALASALPQIYLYVGSNRRESALLAELAGCHYAILDDGMQHRRLGRDFDICILDGRQSWDENHLFPRGLLREGLSSLKRADLLVINPWNPKVEQVISPFTSAPAVGMEYRVSKIKTLQGREIESLDGVSCGIFCGIAQPERFRETVEKTGVRVVKECFLPDHVGLDAHSLRDFAMKATQSGAEWLLCTEKDAVKLSESECPELAIAVVYIEPEIVHGVGDLDSLMDLCYARPLM